MLVCFFLSVILLIPGAKFGRSVYKLTTDAIEKQIDVLFFSEQSGRNYDVRANQKWNAFWDSIQNNISRGNLKHSIDLIDLIQTCYQFILKSVHQYSPEKTSLAILCWWVEYRPCSVIQFWWRILFRQRNYSPICIVGYWLSMTFP